MSMRVILGALVGLIIVVIGVTDGRDQSTYTTRYDHIDLDRILNSRRLVNNYVDCLMGRKRCIPDGSELKKTLPDALRTGCEKCNEKQRNTAERVIRHLMKERPADWERLTKKYDPSGEYKKRYATVAKEVFSKP